MGQDPALVTGMSTPGARGSARQGTRESASATWTPMPAVRSSGLPLVQDIIHLRLVLRMIKNLELTHVTFIYPEYESDPEVNTFKRFDL